MIHAILAQPEQVIQSSGDAKPQVLMGEIVQEARDASVGGGMSLVFNHAMDQFAIQQCHMNFRHMNQVVII